MEIQNVTDKPFQKYGKILNDPDFGELIKCMTHTPLPGDEVIYVPSVEEFEMLPVAKELKENVYGGLPVQIGYCNGNNRTLNAVEYHKGSEVNVAVTDLVLLLGRQQDIKEDFTYHTDYIEAFYLPKGTAVELYATTLHYAPCNGSGEGFRCVVVLPYGTNMELDGTTANEGEVAILFAKNKWLISHEEAGIENSFTGLKGKNVTI